MITGITVFGDIMLDTYVTCKNIKVSPEAPVLTAQFTTQIGNACGGAANVAANICSLDGRRTHVNLVGIVGADLAGQRLLQTDLPMAEVHTEHIKQLKHWITTQKTRYIDSNHRHLFRLDQEAPPMLPEEGLLFLRAQLDKLLATSKTLVISDYNKSTCPTGLIESAIDKYREADRFVVVNGKPSHLKHYAGASVIIFNEKEALEACHEPEGAYIEDVGDRLRCMTGAEHIIITRGSKGLCCVSKDTTIAIPAVPTNVADVTGAGDTVTATIALWGCCDQAALKAAVRKASLVVGQFGTTICGG